MLWINLVGLFFLVEGAINVLYWRFIGEHAPGEHAIWTVGRLFRTALGLVLILFG